jgi:TolA-binding protein
MSHDAQMLERLGTDLQSAFVGKLGPERRRSQKNALRAFVAAGRSAWPLRALHGLAMAAAVAFLVVASILLFYKAGSKEFSNVPFVSSDASGMSFETPAESSLEMTFKDGSRIELGAGTRGTITQADQDRVRIILTDGLLSASVKKKTGVSWSFEAGSYTVTVKGTKFRLAWDQEKEVMDLHVEEGKVVVQGQGIEAQGVDVVSGNHLKADEKKGKVSVKPCVHKRDEWRDLAPLPPEEGKEAGEAGDQEPATQLEGALGTLQKEWKLLIGQGQYAEAMKIARKAGIKKITALLSMQDLWELATAARYAEDADSARKILLAVRSRFKDTHKARIAAFLLGKVAAELQKDPAEATVWFNVYLKEDPAGPLAAEALGRLVEAYADSGRKQDAAGAAEKYLDKYPDGIFSDTARKVVGP